MTFSRPGLTDLMRFREQSELACLIPRYMGYFGSKALPLIYSTYDLHEKYIWRLFDQGVRTRLDQEGILEDIKHQVKLKYHVHRVDISNKNSPMEEIAGPNIITSINNRHNSREFKTPVKAEYSVINKPDQCFDKNHLHQALFLCKPP